jgi:hypothetical protein
MDTHPQSAQIMTGVGEHGHGAGQGGAGLGEGFCAQSGRTPTPRTGVLDGFDKQHHHDEAPCGWFHCQRNTPANRDPGGSPEQQDYVLRVDTHPQSAQITTGEGEHGHGAGWGGGGARGGVLCTVRTNTYERTCWMGLINNTIMTRLHAVGFIVGATPLLTGTLAGHPSNRTTRSG